MAYRGGPNRRGWRRTRWTALLSAALVAITFVMPQAGSAQESPPDTGEMRNGTATATAILARYVPGVGQLSLGITNGTAITKVTNQLAQATSQVTDLGLIGSSLTSESCGEASQITPDDLPQPTFVDNRDGDASVSRDESHTDGAPIGAGRMTVSARKDVPEAEAHTTAAGLDVPGALRLGGGTAESTTRVLPGKGREAIATVESSLSVAGVVELRGMRWEAHHRTGVDPGAGGSFEIGSARLGGVPFPTDDLSTVESALNTLLAPSGISVSLPHTERLTEPNDLVRVTPMRVELRDSPAGKTALGPALDLSREQRSQLFDSLVKLYCKSASALLVGDVGLSIVSGTGFLTVEIGGVEATSSDLVLGNPFGAPVPPPAVAVPPPPAGSPALGAATPAAPDVVAPAAPAAVAPGRPAVASGPLDEVCESIHPNHDGCSQGAGAVAGVVGLLATVSVAGADLFRQRRLAIEVG